MGKYMLLAGLNCKDPSREDEFNKWYNETHLPDVLEVEGFVKATRWEHTSPGEGEAKFVALYEIETDDIDGAMARVNAALAEKAAQGRMSDLSERVIGAVYKKLYELEQ